ncbi:MAG TPA: NUDIX domain-containing protein [Candidatus Saccharimonadales bacterium]|nr:NUDIX domain-containing protein [Candidatus Saccharimonadales bacterium]
MADEKKFHVGVKAMIVNEQGKLLLMKEDVRRHSLPTSEYWDFPGGRMQEKESVLDALAREVEEETGVTQINDPEFVTAVISNHEIKLKDGEVVGLVLMVYKVKIDLATKIKLSHEHLAFEWVGKAEAKQRLTHKYPKAFTDQL